MNCFFIVSGDGQGQVKEEKSSCDFGSCQMAKLLPLLKYTLHLGCIGGVPFIS